jgi:hypothetical protein
LVNFVVDIKLKVLKIKIRLMRIDLLKIFIITNFSLWLLLTSVEAQTVPYFKILVRPPFGETYPGGSTYTTVSVYYAYPYPIVSPQNPITFSCSNLPPGVSCSFSPPSCSVFNITQPFPEIPICTSLLTISTSPTTPQGFYTITILATSGNLTRTAPYILSIKSQPTTTTIKYPMTVV